MTDLQREIAECPFCGGEAEAVNYVIEAEVRCLSCGAKVVRSHGARDDNGLPEAIDAWNRRQHHAAIAEAVRDAERYRWLRDRNFGFVHDEAGRGISVSRWGDWPYDTDEGHAASCDAAIDAAKERNDG